MSEAESALPAVIDGRYRLDRHVADGAFGSVHAGYHMTLEVPVAIKILRVARTHDPKRRADLVGRLLDEGRTLTRLRHPNIVVAMDLGLLPPERDGTVTPYLVMEWAEGQSLRTMLDQRQKGFGLPEAWSLFEPMLDAIAYAHTSRVAHRDLKPANVMILRGPDGRLVPRVIDFGIAKLVGEGEDDPGSGETRTRSNWNPFTAAYAAPEQLLRSRTGPWTDVHALGLIFVELVTGQDPYRASTVDELRARVLSSERPTPRSRGVDVGPFEQVIARALALVPRDRYASAVEMLAAAREAATASELETAADLAVTTAIEIEPAPDTQLTGDAPTSYTARTGAAPASYTAPPAADRAPAHDTSPLSPGARLGKRFTIEALASHGGMGSVYRARDDAGGAVAIKVVTESDERFEREAEVLAEVRHPNIVRFLDRGTLADGRAFVAMEWASGETLAQRLQRGRLSVQESVTVARQVALALGAAHRLGIVHRDVKPANIVLGDTGADSIRLVDFGVARRLDGDLTLTSTGEIVGTVQYMSPEQARGAREIDVRSDVFSLGSVLFECLTGRRAFVADAAHAVLFKIVLDPSPFASELAPDVPEEVDDLLARMLAKSPDERPRDGDDVARALDAITVAAPPSRRARVISEAERRVIAIVVTRTTPKSRRWGPISAAPPVDGFDGALTTVAARHHASLDRFADGSVLASFVGRDATELAIRAARCALALREVLPNEPMAAALETSDAEGRVRIGDVIDRGVPLFDVPSPSDSQLHPAAVRIDDDLASLLVGRFDVGEDAAGRYLRGESVDPTARRTLLGKPTECIGRDAELSLLGSLFDECAEEPRARAVLVTGAAGLGKSHLGSELIRRLCQRRPGIGVWRADGDPMSAGSSLAMISRMIRSQAGLVEGEEPEAVERKLSRRVARTVPAGDVAATCEFLAALASVPLASEPSVALRAARDDAVIMGDRMRGAWEDFVHAEASAAPLLIVLEDLQWGDRGTVSFLDGTLRRLADLPIFVLALARPEIDAIFPKLWANRAVQVVALRELGKRASEQLVRSALGEGAGVDVVARILERASGNPFYLEELIRAEASGRTDGLPDSVLATVAARIAGFEAESRRLLRAASVFGQSFWRGGLIALLGGSADRASAVDDRLGQLEDAEILVRRKTSRIAGEQELAFRHALLREAAYAMLPDADREAGHRLAGDWLARIGGADSLELAEHFEQGGDGARASRFFLAAAERALASNDLEGAINRVDRGLACAVDSSLIGALHVVRADACRWVSRIDEAERSAQRALELVERGSTAWCTAATHHAIVAAGRGAVDRVRTLARDALELEPPMESAPAYVVLLSALATLLAQMGTADEAARARQRADQLAARVTRRDPVMLAWLVRAQAAAESVSDVEARIAGYTRSLALFEEAGDLRRACQERGNLAFAYFAVGLYQEAERLLRHALDAAVRLGSASLAAGAQANLGITLARLGRAQEGRGLEEQAIAGFTEASNLRMVGGCRHYLSLILRACGDRDLALREAEKAAEILAIAPSLRISALANLARLHLELGRPGEALRIAEQTATLMESVAIVVDGDALPRLVHAEALAANGREAEARAAIGVAHQRLVARAGRIGNPAWRRAFLEAIPEHARTIEIAERGFR